MVKYEQEDYIKAYEELGKTGTNVNALVMLTEMSYEEKNRLVEYKNDKRYRPEDYDERINTVFKHMISTFFKLDNANRLYGDFKENYSQKYLDNTDDDTNDYRNDTMIKLNKIFHFVNNLEGQDLKGTELLSLIRNEIDEDSKEVLSDYYFDIQFKGLKSLSDRIRLSNINEKIDMIPSFLHEIGDMEAHLFKRKLFYDDYRKSVTGLVNYLLSRAGIPEIYIKPIELDEYYSYVNKGESLDNEEIVTFYKEKMCDSIEDLLIVPMKNIVSNYLDQQIKRESGELDNKIITLKQNKYK